MTRLGGTLLAPAVEAALGDPAPGTPMWTEAGGRRWFSLRWGEATDPPMLLIHGVTSDSGTFWRLGPAVAASGRRVIALDLPGHGATGAWRGEHRFVETAGDVVGFADAAGLVRPDLAVLGHSWGGMIGAALPAAGLHPARLILLDPPFLSGNALEAMTHDPEEQPTPDIEAAVDALAAAHPDWAPGDVRAKAEGLARFDREAVRQVLLENGDWDAGLGGLAHPEAAEVPVWLIRGDFEWGGLIPDSAVPAIQERLGADRVVTIAGGPHSPQRTHIEELTATLLDILA